MFPYDTTSVISSDTAEERSRVSVSTKSMRRSDTFPWLITPQAENITHTTVCCCVLLSGPYSNSGMGIGKGKEKGYVTSVV